MTLMLVFVVLGLMGLVLWPRMAQTVNVVKANLKVTQYDFDPDSADPVDVAWVDMRDFERILISFFRTVGTGDVDTLRILANANPDGSGTDVVVLTKTLTGVQPNAVGDFTFLEASAEQIREACVAAGVDGRYVSLQVEFQTSTDEGVVTYIREPGRRRYDGLTSDNIA